MFTQLHALKMCLESLIEHRVAIRKEYVDRDKEIGREMKDILARIREIEESNSSLVGLEKVSSGEEVAVATVVHEETEPFMREAYARPRRARYDYAVDVVPRAIEILKEVGTPMKGSEIIRALQDKYQLTFSNPTITMNKIIGITSSIKKENGYFVYVFDTE